MLTSMPKKPLFPQSDLAERLRRALEESSVSQADLARACDVTDQAVHGWVTNGRIAKQHLVTICTLTKKPLEFFLVGLGRAAVVAFLALSFLFMPTPAEAADFCAQQLRLCIMLNMRRIKMWLISRLSLLPYCAINT